MKKDLHSDLDLQRPPSRKDSLNGPRLHNMQAIKAHLLEEIIELESKLDKVKSSGEAVDLSLIQTYREMIHSRRAFFNELSR